MKKVIALSIALITLFSCSKDEITETQKDPIIGLWKLSNHKTKTLIDCEKNSTFEFLDTGVININLSNFVAQSNSCTSIKSKRLWKNSGRNNTLYAIFEQGETETEKDGQLELIFSNNNNTFTTKNGEIWTRQTQNSTPLIPKDSIIGTWHLLSENKKEVSDCRKQGTISFSEDKKFATQGYYTDKSGKCLQNGKSKGIWANKGNGIYGIKKEEDNKVEDVKIIFKDDSITITYREGGKTFTQSYKKGTFKYTPPKEVTKNPILGTWYKFSFNDKEVSNCEKKSVAQFNEDFSYKDTPYVTDNNGKCIIDGESSGTWKYNNGAYYFNNKTVPIKFTDDNKTLIVGEGTNEKLVYKKEKTSLDNPIDPDPILEVKDPIIGSWYKFSDNGSKTSNCSRKGGLNFIENGDYSSTDYYTDSNNNCKKNSESKGKWINKGNNIYSVTVESKSSDANVVFSDNNNTFTIKFPSKEIGKTEILVYKRK